MSRALQGLMVLLAAFILIVAASFLSQASHPQNDPASTSGGKAGTLALYTWLADVGYSTSRLEGSFNPGGTGTLLILEPTVILSQTDAATLRTFMDNGGTVVLADDTGLASGVLGKFQVYSDGAATEGDAHPARSYSRGGAVRTVPVANASSLSADRASPVLTMNGQNVGITQAVGKGSLVVFSSPQPFTNDGLRRGDSALFVLSLLQHSASRLVAFDEYHHGASSQAPGVLGEGIDQVFSGPLGLATLLAVLLILGALAVNGRRLGRPVPRNNPALVPSATDRLKAMAQLFARSGDKGAIAADYVDELKEHIGKRQGVDPRLDDGAFVDALATGPVDDTRELLVTGRRLERSRPSEGQLLALAKAVVDLESRWDNPVAAPN